MCVKVKGFVITLKPHILSGLTQNLCVCTVMSPWMGGNDLMVSFDPSHTHTGVHDWWDIYRVFVFPPSLKFIWDVPVDAQTDWLWEAAVGARDEPSRQILTFWSLAAARLRAGRKDLKNQLPEIITPSEEQLRAVSEQAWSLLLLLLFELSSSFSHKHWFPQKPHRCF